VGDIQCGHERTLTGLIPALAGASLIYGAGLLEAGMAVDMSVLVADNEFIRMMRQVCAGIPTNETTLMVEEIIARGPEAEYISSESTLRGVKGLSTSKLIDRHAREAWTAEGSKDMYERARAEARRILQEETVEPLPSDVIEKLDRIVAQADEKYAGVLAHS
jgi:trimethylamine--corrinoid protein Co-methyltransferase